MNAIGGSCTVLVVGVKFEVPAAVISDVEGVHSGTMGGAPPPIELFVHGGTTGDAPPPVERSVFFVWSIILR